MRASMHTLCLAGAALSALAAKSLLEKDNGFIDTMPAVGDPGNLDATDHDFEYAIASIDTTEDPHDELIGINGHIDGGTRFIAAADIGLDCIRLDGVHGHLTDGGTTVIDPLGI